MCPSYLSDLLSKKVYSRSLRSADSHSIETPLFTLRTVSDRSFSSVGPRLWKTFHYLFVMAHKSAPMQTPAPHSQLSFVLIHKSANYSGLSSASPVLQTVSLVWNVGYPRHTESPSGCMYAIENSPA